ncbi:hypothetical protein QFZ98_004448 [Paraburkholderia youngii]
MLATPAKVILLTPLRPRVRTCLPSLRRIAWARRPHARRCHWTSARFSAAALSVGRDPAVCTLVCASGCGFRGAFSGRPLKKRMMHKVPDMARCAHNHSIPLRNPQPVYRPCCVTRCPSLPAWRAPSARTCRPQRSVWRRLQLPRKPQGDLQPRHEAQHSREPAWTQGSEAQSQAAFRCGHLRGALSHHRARVSLRGHALPPAAALRAHQ